MQQEMEHFSKRCEHEKEVFQRLREQEVQKVRESEMNARAATNLEASIYQEKQKTQQEVQLLQKEKFHLKRRQDTLAAELQQATKDSDVYRYRHKQAELDVAVIMQQQGASGTAEEVDAAWRQEYQSEVDQLEQRYQQARSESHEAHRHLIDRERQDKDKERHCQEQAISLQSRTAQLVQEQNMVVSEQQAAHRAGLRARDMELHAQAQAAELNQREAQFQEEWMFLQQECAKLTEDKDMMMVDLIACQDMIHEESQASQQYRRQLLGQQSLPRLVDDLRAHRERNELWAVGAGDAVDYRDDGRSLRQPTVLEMLVMAKATSRR